MPIPTSQEGADELAKSKPEDAAKQQAEQSKAAIENMNDDFDGGGSGISGLKPEAGETRVIGQSDPTGTKR